MTFSDIDVFLAACDVDTSKETSDANSKWVYVKELLADETAAATAALGEREIAVAERERVVTEAEQSQGLRDKELLRREKHLREAGVRGF